MELTYSTSSIDGGLAFPSGAGGEECSDAELRACREEGRRFRAACTRTRGGVAAGGSNQMVSSSIGHRREQKNCQGLRHGFNQHDDIAQKCRVINRFNEVRVSAAAKA